MHTNFKKRYEAILKKNLSNKDQLYYDLILERIASSDTEQVGSRMQIKWIIVYGMNIISKSSTSCQVARLVM